MAGNDDHRKILRDEWQEAQGILSVVSKQSVRQWKIAPLALRVKTGEPKILLGLRTGSEVGGEVFREFYQHHVTAYVKRTGLQILSFARNFLNDCRRPLVYTM